MPQIAESSCSLAKLETVILLECTLLLGGHNLKTARALGRIPLDRLIYYRGLARYLAGAGWKATDWRHA